VIVRITVTVRTLIRRGSTALSGIAYNAWVAGSSAALPQLRRSLDVSLGQQKARTSTKREHQGIRRHWVGAVEVV
jgi:hypothetical protein